VVVKLTKIQSARYYTAVAREARQEQGLTRYYRQGGSAWVGRLATGHFRLAGEPKGQELANLFNRRSPDGQDLGAPRGGRNRVKAFDLHAAPDKTFSVLEALAPPDRQAELVRDFEEATGVMLSFAEQELCYARRGKAGRIREKAQGFAGAAVTHALNRNGEMQRHRHILLASLTLTQPGDAAAPRWQSLDASPLYQNQATLNAIMMMELSYLLERRGVETRRAYEVHSDPAGEVRKAKPWFTVPGITDEQARPFSTRREEVLEDMRRRKVRGAQESDWSALRTRKKKDPALSPEDLLPFWWQTARKAGLTPGYVEGLFGRTIVHEGAPAQRVEQAIRQAVKTLSDSRAHFTKHEVIRHACEAGISQGISFGQLLPAVEQRLEASQEFVKRGTVRGLERYSTRQNYEREESLLGTAGRLAAKNDHAATARRVDKVLSKRRWRSLSDEQRKAVEALARGPDLGLMSGLAGTGKTHTLNCLREVLKSDFTLVGAAYTGRAAKELQDGAKIRSTTIHRLLLDLEGPSFKQRWKHHLKQLWRAARKKPTYKLRKRTRLTPKTVVVLDECGQIPTHLLNRVLRHIERAGAKAVCVGDAGQTQPIEAGGPFRSLLARHRDVHVSLRRVIRQQDDPRSPNPAWQRQATECFAGGRTAEGLELFKQHRRLTVAPDREKARERMVADWLQAGGARDPGSHLMLASTREDVFRLNQMAQARRMELGLLRGFRVRATPRSLYLGTPHVKSGGETIFEGDRVMLGRNFTWTSGKRRVEVKNGQLGLVTRIDQVKDEISVLLDGQKKAVTLSLKHYNKYGDAISLGYASTVYKSQGSSLRHVRILGGNLDRELSYVGLSRHKVSCQLYVAEADYGEEGKELVRTMAKSNQKDLFLDQPHRPGPELEMGG